MSSSGTTSESDFIGSVNTTDHTSCTSCWYLVGCSKYWGQRTRLEIKVAELLPGMSSETMHGCPVKFPGDLLTGP